MERDNFPTFRRIGRGIAGWSARRRRGLIEWVHGDWVGRLCRLGIGLLALFVLLAIPWTYFNITLGMALEREIEQIRERGEPVTIEHAVPEMPPRDENAALVYNEIFRLEDWAFTAEIENPEPDPTPSLLEQIPDEFQRARDLPEQFDDPDEILRRAMDDPTLQRVFALLEEAAGRPKCVFPIPWEHGPAALFPHMEQLRECAQWLQVCVRLSAEHGEAAEAMKWLHVGLHMSEHTRQTPTLIGQLVAYAIEAIMMDAAEDALSVAEIPRESTRRLVAEDYAVRVAEDFRNALLLERIWTYGVFDWVEETEDAEKTPAELLGSARPVPEAYARLYLSPIGLPLRKYDRLRYLRMTAPVAEVVSVPYRSIPRELRNREAPPDVQPLLAPIASGLLPMYARAAAKRDWAIVQFDQLQIALALSLYRQEHGEYPRTLEPLADTVDRPIPDDIFSGEPFGYRREGDGYVLWSVGPDLDDDGGVSADEAWASWFDDSDMVWRVEG